jgi:hypothetical protein
MELLAIHNGTLSSIYFSTPLVSTALRLSYFPAQNSTPLAFGENRPAGGKLQGRTELNLTSVVAADSFL